MSAVLMQQHQSSSPFFDIGELMYKNQNTSVAANATQPPPQHHSQQQQHQQPQQPRQMNNKAIMKGGHQQQQRHLHHPHNQFNGRLNYGLPPSVFDKNNNALLMENLDLINSVVQQLPPSSPTNSTTSSMSTSSSSCCSTSSMTNNNSNSSNNMHPFMLKQLINQHSTLQRTISHPLHSLVQQQQQPHHHHQMNFANSLMENLNAQQQQQQNLNGCGDAQPTPNAVLAHRKLERTQSEPLPQQQQLVNTSRYKTELCRPFEEAGECKYGDKCQFAHGYNELRNLQRHPRYKTELCRTFHSAGYCPYGPRCHFVHNQEEVRANPPPQLTLPQHNMVGRTTSLQMPMTLSPAMSMSTGSDRASPTGSLSMSPTNSMVNFFPESAPGYPLSTGATFPFSNTKISAIIPSPPESPRDLSPTPMMGLHGPLSSSSSTSSVCSNGAGAGKDMGEARLPVFNRLSSTIESAFNTLEI